MDVTRSTPLGAYYHTQVINKREQGPVPTRFPTNSPYTPMGNTSLHLITNGARRCCAAVYACTVCVDLAKYARYKAVTLVNCCYSPGLFF